MHPLVGAQPAATLSMNPITEISIERDCFGCASGWVLVLRRDGKAQRTLRGKARHRTQDIVMQGRVPLPDFESLARLIEAQNFFALVDEYQVPGLQDGPWTVVRVARGNLDKQVFRRDEAGPDALKQIEAAIDAVAARVGLGFQPP